LKHKLQWTTTN